MKLSFKKSERTGRYASFQVKSTAIKADGLKCGWLQEERQGTLWHIFLHVKTEATAENPCPFKNIHLKMTFTDEQAARNFIKKNWTALRIRYDLYQMED